MQGAHSVEGPAQLPWQRLTWRSGRTVGQHDFGFRNCRPVRGKWVSQTALETEKHLTENVTFYPSIYSTRSIDHSDSMRVLVNDLTAQIRLTYFRFSCPPVRLCQLCRALVVEAIPRPWLHVISVSDQFIFTPVSRTSELTSITTPKKINCCHVRKLVWLSRKAISYRFVPHGNGWLSSSNSNCITNCLFQVVNQSDPNWWQAKKVGWSGPAGLIPSQELEERRKAFVAPEADFVHKIGFCGTRVSCFWNGFRQLDSHVSRSSSDFQEEEEADVSD